MIACKKRGYRSASHARKAHRFARWRLRVYLCDCGFYHAAPEPPQRNYPIGAVVLWSIACLSLGFAAAGLLLGCGPIVPTGSNNCCYGSADTSVQECAGFLDGCVFIATGEAGCGEMICD